jgi:excisionase family DNA binding protein
LSTRSKPSRLVGHGENALKLLADEIGESVDFSTAANILGLHLSTLHRWRMSGTLEAWRLGGRWRVSVESIRKMIHSGSTASSVRIGAAAPGMRTESERKAAADAAMAEIAQLSR